MGSLPSPPSLFHTRQQLAARIGFIVSHEAHAANGTTVSAVDATFFFSLREKLVVLDVFLI